MTDQERDRLVARLEGVVAGLELASRMAAIHQRQLRSSRPVSMPVPKRDAFDKFTDFITLEWLFK